MIEYKITRKNEMKHLEFVLEGIVFSALSIPFLFYVKGAREINVLLIIALILLLLYTIPACILYLKYYSINEGKVMVYEPNELKITIANTKKGTKSIFILDDIRYIYHVMTGAKESNGLYLTSWSKYNYYKLCLNNEEVHIITSLMVDKLELPVGEKYEIVTSFYPYP